jgi:hypothetical protein
MFCASYNQCLLPLCSKGFPQISHWISTINNWKYLRYYHLHSLFPEEIPPHAARREGSTLVNPKLVERQANSIRAHRERTEVPLRFLISI